MLVVAGLRLRCGCGRGTSDCEFWRDVTRITEQSNNVVMPNRHFGDSNAYFTGFEGESARERRVDIQILAAVREVTQEYHTGDVAFLWGDVGHIPGDIFGRPDVPGDV